MKKTMIVLIGVLMLCSCQQDELFKERRDLGRTPETGSGRMGISRSTHKITPQEAAIVACLERFGPACTKGEVEEDVSEVIPICGDVGDTLMYVVQYTEAGGYMVVSATKNYYPILVEVEQGEYNSELIAQTGASLYYDSYKEAIQASEGQPEDSVVQMRMQWLPYLERSVPARVETKSTNDELLDLVESSIAEWEEEGYEYHFLFEGKPEFLPQAVFDQWMELARDLGNGNYDYMENSVIVGVPSISNESITPKLLTDWVQFFFMYNAIAGLVTVGEGPLSMAQVMAYYRTPTYFNWDQIITEDNTDVNEEFIKYVVRGLCTEEDIEDRIIDSNIDDMFAYMPTIGLRGQLVTHSMGPIYSALRNYGPVIMSGSKRVLNNLEEHCWLCDGYRSISVSIRYELKVLSYFSPMTYETVDSYAANTNHANAGRYYYLNFIGSQADGFYKDDQMPYTITRRDIINIQRN